MVLLPAWASLLTRVNIKESYVNEFVADSDVDKVLELHGRACLTDYVKGDYLRSLILSCKYKDKA